MGVGAMGGLCMRLQQLSPRLSAIDSCCDRWVGLASSLAEEGADGRAVAIVD